MAALIKSIDLFGQEVNLYVNQKTQVKTIFGGMLSIAIIAVMIAATWIIGNDIIYKTKPISNTETQITPTANKVILNPQKFSFAIVLMNSDNTPVNDPTMFYIGMDYFVEKLNKETGLMEVISKTTLSLDKCTSEHFPTLTNEQINSAQLLNMLCLPLGRDFEILGSFVESELNFLNIYLKMCDWDITPDYCKTHAEIIDWSGKNFANFNMFVVNTAVQYTNYENPLQNYVVDEYRFISSDVNKVTQYELQTQKLITDKGWILPEKEEEEFIKLQKMVEDSIAVNPDVKMVGRFKLMASNRSDIFSRKYIQITDILAQVGGLIKSLSIIALVINIPNKTRSYFTTIANGIFDFDVEQDKKLGSVKINPHNEIIQTNNPNNPSYSNPQVSVNHQMLNVNKRKNNNMLFQLNRGGNGNKPKVDMLKLTPSEAFKLSYCCGRSSSPETQKKYQLYRKSQEKIMGFSDIVSILKIFLEFNNLKEILFSQDQNKLFHSVKTRMTVKDGVDNKINITDNRVPEREGIDQRLIKFVNENQ